MSKTKQVFSIRIDPDTLRKIQRLAKKDRTTVGAIVRGHLDKFLKLKEKKHEGEDRD